MAKPIEPTPTLKDKDAERFYQSLEESEYNPKKDRLLYRAEEVFTILSKNMGTVPSVLKPKE